MVLPDGAEEGMRDGASEGMREGASEPRLSADCSLIGQVSNFFLSQVSSK